MVLPETGSRALPVCQLLVIDSNPGVSLMIQRYLAQDSAYNYQFEVATNGARGLELARSFSQTGKNPGCIFLDFDLPDMSGLEFLIQFRRQASLKAPLIMISSLSRVNLAVEALQNGAQDFLVKDQFTPGELRRAVESAITRGILVHEIEQQQIDLIQKNRQLEEQRRAVEKKNSELEILNSRVNSILRSISDAFFALDEDWRIIYLNPKAKQYFQKAGDPEGKIFWEEFPASINSPFYHAYHKALKEQITITIEDFSPILNCWVDVRVYPSPEGLLIFFQDISSRKKEEEALRRRQQEFETLVENAPDIIARYDQNGRLVYINKAATSVFGREPEKMLGKSSLEIGIPAEMAAAWETALARVLVTGEEALQEMNFVSLNGSHFFSARMVPEYGPDGQTIETALVISRDMTSLKEAETALQASEQRLRTVVNNMPVVLFATDKQGVITFLEGKGIEGLGLIRGKVLGLSAFQLDPGNPELEELGPKLLAGGKVETSFKVGEYFLELFALPLLNSQGEITGLTGVLIDITARKKVEEALQQSEEKLRQAQKMEAIGLLAGGIAHDFNNILTSITGYGELALLTAEKESQLFLYLTEITKSADRAATLTRQLLAFSRRQMLQPKVLNLNNIVQELDGLLRRLIGEDIELFALPNPNLAMVKVDPGQIGQVIMNLVVNARDAMPRGGRIIIETSNEKLDEEFARKHPGSRSGQFVLLTVTDTGLGMDAATKEKIFEPFFTTKETGKGTGLGLSTVYGIIKQSEGYIGVYSEPGKGSSFKVYLPLVEEEVSQVEDPKPLSELKSGSETVLLVEDEEAVRGLVKRLLESRGYRVLEASHGPEALLLEQKHRAEIELVLTDVVMPQMSGPELARRLLRRNPGLKVIFMSGYTGEALVRNHLVNKEVNLLQKPFTAASLTRKVREVLDSNPGPPPASP